MAGFNDWLMFVGGPLFLFATSLTYLALVVFCCVAISRWLWLLIWMPGGLVIATGGSVLALYFH